MGRDLKSSHKRFQIEDHRATSTRGGLEMRESGMRSLARPGLLRIFAPLDPNERLPGELFLKGRRLRLFFYRGFNPRRAAHSRNRTPGEASRHRDWRRTRLSVER